MADTPMRAVMPDGSHVVVMVGPETAAAVASGHRVVTGDGGRMQCEPGCPALQDHLRGDDRG